MLFFELEVKGIFGILCEYYAVDLMQNFLKLVQRKIQELFFLTIDIFISVIIPFKGLTRSNCFFKIDI